MSKKGGFSHKGALHSPPCGTRESAPCHGTPHTSVQSCPGPPCSQDCPNVCSIAHRLMLCVVPILWQVARQCRAPKVWPHRRSARSMSSWTRQLRPLLLRSRPSRPSQGHPPRSQPPRRALRQTHLVTAQPTYPSPAFDSLQPGAAQTTGVIATIEGDLAGGSAAGCGSVLDDLVLFSLPLLLPVAARRPGAARRRPRSVRRCISAATTFVRLGRAARASPASLATPFFR